MINLIIDTCSLINLLNEDKGDFLIGNLEYWVNHKRVRLFTHEIILKEWDEHKEKQRTSFRASQQAKFRHVQEFSQRYDFHIPKEIQPDTQIIDTRIRKIDELLGHATVLKTSNEAKIKSSDRSILKKAPFHNKLDSTKDAYIIFTALEFFQQELQPFTFISDNKGEFGDPNDTERMIHRELTEDYVGAAVEYYREIGWAIRDLRKIIDISPPVEDFATLRTKVIAERVRIDKSKNLLDQLHDYLDLMHQDIVYFPPRILINHYPFRTGNENSVHYRLFNAESGNQQLLELLQKFSMSTNGKLSDNLHRIFPDVVEAEKKCKAIMKWLTRDLIFSVSNRNRRKSAVTRYTEGPACHCAICEFRRFNFVNSFSQLKEKPENATQHLALGYAHYHAGNYLQSSQHMKIGLDFSDQSKQLTTSFILSHNLSALSTFLSNHYYKNKEVETLAEEYSRISLPHLIHRYANPKNWEVLDLIAENKFLAESKEQIHHLHYKILDDYYESLRGTVSSNSHVWEIKNHYAEIIHFLNDNRIVFDRFSEFYALSNRVFEAMIASHAKKSSRGSRLDGFDDWTLHQMLRYGETDKLNKFHARYKFIRLKYEDTRDEGGRFPDLIGNLFSSHKGLRAAFAAFCETANRSFWDYYTNVISNALVLFSITDLDDETTKTLSVQLMEFLSGEDFLSKENAKYVGHVVKRIGEKFDTPVLIRLLWIAVKSKKYHGEHLIETIFGILNDRKKKLEISEDEFQALKANFVEFGPDGQITRVHNNLVHFCKNVREDTVRQELSAIVACCIRENYGFDFYWYATIHDAYLYEPSDFDKVLQSALPPPGKKPALLFFGEPSDRFLTVNHFMNLCFKLDLDTTSEKFQLVRKLGPYYQWLTDMENFDYTHFEPSWAGEYATRYYFRRIAGCNKVREFLEAYLKREYDTDIERIYINIFVRRAWDVGNM